ncbi:transglutaminase domain-containing protein [Halopiger djelfimassiliensis]|uniref:transglutaminase domain-containing protein n=1 Tax=Halopiger djelfimassiliensis TaxID=1293047 RepID=UPI00067823A8|nr:transglutaminase domain-containing protein [Halopiger djelfimassiliensis]
MSTDAKSRTAGRTLSLDLDGAFAPGLFRLLALGCVLLLTASYVSVLRDITGVVGGTRSLFALVGTMLVLATVLARVIRPRTATSGAIVAAGLGFAYYLETAGVGVEVVLSATEAIVDDVLTLISGLSLLRTVEAGVLTLGIAPAPVFLSWYLALRGRYGLSVVSGGIALCFLVLTGDAGMTITLLGTLAAIGAVGFGELERRGGSIAQADLLAVLFALSILLSLSVSFVPGGPARPTAIGGSEPGTLEGTLDSASERSGIGGQVDLSPEVRFTVESDRPSYWRTGVYDRFSGDEWIRTGQAQSLEEGLTEPPGKYDRVRHVVTAETELAVMPAAPHPLSIEGGVENYATASMHGQVRPETTLIEGDSYAVESAIVDPEPRELRAAGTNYPKGVTKHYLQRPEDTSSEFAARTATVTEDADNPYETAVAIEDHLRTSKAYSLDVEQPSGNAAEAFLLEMDEGYCVYFATTMTQMLRAEGIPARYATGYTSGQQVDDGTYVVRGLDAHAWVEVYFPGHGWVAFDPTPSDERDAVHEQQLSEARSDGNEAADTEESEDVPLDEDESGNTGSEVDPDTGANEGEQSPNDSPDPDGEPPDTNGTDPDDPGEGSSESTGAQADSDGTELRVPITITRELVAIATVVMIGFAAGVHRTGARSRLRRTVGLYWQRSRSDPNADVERAYRRLERLLAREHRPRRRSESPRAYLAALAEDTHSEQTTELDPADPRIQRVFERYERAVYGDGVSRSEADSAVATVDELARERLPVVGRGRN